MEYRYGRGILPVHRELKLTVLSWPPVVQLLAGDLVVIFAVIPWSASRRLWNCFLKWMR